MATRKTLTLVTNRPLGPASRLLEFESASDIGFVGGQFLIVDTGLRKEDGQPIKRCYSIPTPDQDQRRIRLAIQQVGAGSRALQALEPGAEVAYSGPWGKLLPGAQPAAGPAWIVATDTGITAALGLVRSRRFRDRLKDTMLLWLDHGPTSLCPLAHVEEQLPRGLGGFEQHSLPAVNDPLRRGVALDLLSKRIGAGGPSPRALWLVGDGDVLFGLQELGSAFTGASLECFFNNPARAIG